MNVSGQTSQALVGEYLPAARGASSGEAAGGSLALPLGGAVLQRVTLLATQPDDTIVLFRADYAPPAAVAPTGVTYEALSSRSSRGTPGRLAQDLPAAEPEPVVSRFSGVASPWLAPAALYARTSGGGAAADATKGGVIDVHA